MDEMIRVGGGSQSFGASSSASTYFQMGQYEGLKELVSGYGLIDHVIPAINETAPVVNITGSAACAASRSWVCVARTARCWHRERSEMQRGAALSSKS